MCVVALCFYFGDGGEDELAFTIHESRITRSLNVGGGELAAIWLEVFVVTLCFCPGLAQK